MSKRRAGAKQSIEHGIQAGLVRPRSAAREHSEPVAEHDLFAFHVEGTFILEGFSSVKRMELMSY